MNDDDIRIRRADPMDDSALELLADRMADFPMPAWRTPGEIAAAFLPRLRRAVHERGRDTALLVAEQGDGSVLGCVLASAQHDEWSTERCARMEMLAVQRGAEGRGAAAALLEACESWARGIGVRRLACDLFDANWRAHRFCEQQGFRRESVRFVKEL